MHRSLTAAAALLLLATACKVEETPAEFYQHRDPSVVERNEAEAEIRTRMEAFRQALGRSDREDAVEALAPGALAVVIGTEEDGGVSRRGPAAVLAALDSVGTGGPAVARMPDLALAVGLRDGVAWFSTHLELLPTTPQGSRERLRMSGVFGRDRADWRLVQLHISEAAPVSEAAPTPPDSAEASRATGSAPGEGG